MRIPIEELLNNLAQELQSDSSHKLIVGLVYTFLEKINKFPDGVPLIHHPLGFFLIRLGKINLSTSLRLHLWLPNRRITQYPDWSVHDHTFTLKSHVLTGEITNKFFNINFESSQPTNCLYRVEYNDNSSVLGRTSQYLSYDQVEQNTYSKGEYYLVEKGRYHSTHVPLECLTSTIALTSDQDNTAPNVIGDLTGQDEYVYLRTVAQAFELREALALLQYELKNKI